mmetsp:Transcript_55266/g.120884  ORF Transcript_55266/g.120884 Transcript_55266/m.120884 type:complete len:270 (-) Transcript_55266:135-944(-)
MACSHSMRTGQSHNVFVCEALGAKNLPKMLSIFVTVRKSPSCRLCSLITCQAVKAPKVSDDVRPTHHLDCHVGGQGPQVSMGNEAWDIFLRNGLQQRNGHLRQARVRSQGMFASSGQTHGCIGAAIHSVEHARIVPRQADHDWTTTLDCHQLLKVRNQVSIGQALANGELQSWIMFALLQHQGHIASDAIHLHNAVASAHLPVGVLVVPLLSDASRDRQNGQDTAFSHEVYIQAQLLPLLLHQCHLVHALLHPATRNCWQFHGRATGRP